MRGNQGILPEPGELARRVEQGETMSAIAREYGVTRQAVSIAIKKAGLHPMVERHPPIDTGYVIEAYESGKSLPQIAKELDVGLSRLMRVAKQAGVTMRPIGWRGGTNRRKDEAEFVERYRNGQTVTQIAADMRCQQMTVRRILVRTGVYEPNRDSHRVEDETKQRILKRLGEGETRYAIALSEGVSRETVERLIHRHELVRQPDGRWLRERERRDYQRPRKNRQSRADDPNRERRSAVGTR